MHEIVGSAGASLGFVDHGMFHVDQTILRIAQAGAQAVAEFTHFFTGNAGGGAQQFFGVGNDDLQVGNQFFFVGICLFGHFATSFNSG